MHLPAFPRGAAGEEPDRGVPPAAARRSRGRDRRRAPLVPHLRATDAAGPALRPKGALTVWQVDEITMDRAREEASFAKVQAAIAYLDSAPAGFFTADADGTIEYLDATSPSGSNSTSPRSPAARSSSKRSCPPTARR